MKSVAYYNGLTAKLTTMLSKIGSMSVTELSEAWDFAMGVVEETQVALEEINRSLDGTNGHKMLPLHQAVDAARSAAFEVLVAVDKRVKELLAKGFKEAMELSKKINEMGGPIVEDMPGPSRKPEDAR